MLLAASNVSQHTPTTQTHFAEGLRIGRFKSRPTRKANPHRSGLYGTSNHGLRDLPNKRLAMISSRPPKIVLATIATKTCTAKANSFLIVHSPWCILGERRAPTSIIPSDCRSAHMDL